MKKIFLVLTITVLSVFIFAAAVSADGNRYRNFQGTYEMSLKGNGLNSPSGFKPPIIPDPEKPEIVFRYPNSSAGVWGSTDTAFGTFIFNSDQSGSAHGFNYAFDLPPGPPGTGPWARANEFYIEFNYSVTPEGVITVDVTFPLILTDVHMVGKVSKDRKTITLTNSNSLLTFDTHESLFTATRVLIKVLNDLEDD
jgi:hypothetical protein